MALTLKDHDRHSYAEYLRWPEDERYELIGHSRSAGISPRRDGVAYLMAPAPSSGSTGWYIPRISYSPSTG